jgi:RHS repeat-associated protein
MPIIEVISVKKNNSVAGPLFPGPKKTPLALLQALAGVACALTATFAFAQAVTSRMGLSVTIPNGYANIVVDDLRVRGTAGATRWSRVWDGKEWKFNSQWESLSQSWTNLTGSQTDASSGGTATASSSSAADAGSCSVSVDEDWQPSTSTTIIDGMSMGTPMLPERTTPFNRLMGENSTDYPPPRTVSVDYASLCHGIPQQSAVHDTEAIRRQNELYLGDNGRYAFTNRTVLEKRAVRGVPVAAAATLDSQLAAGRMTLSPIAIEKGFRWMDKAGEWIDYNTQGQVVAFGDTNNNTVWLVRDTNGTLRGVVDANGRVMYTLHYSGNLITEVRDYPIADLSRDLPARSVKYQYDAANRLTQVTDARGNTTQYGYDASNHIVQITDQEGRIETLAYAGSSVAKRTAPDGGVTDYVFEYDDTNKQFASRIIAPETPAGRRVEDFTHNRSGQLVRRAVNGRIDDEVRYDTGARAEMHTNARGFTSRMTKNEYDQIVQLDQEDGTTIKRSYSALNLQLTEAIDEMGVKTQYQYDTKGNMTKRVEAAGTPDQRVTEYEVDTLGQTTRVTSKGRTETNGTVTADATWVFDYDAQGQLMAVTDPEGNTRKLMYDRAGNIVSSTDPRGNTSLFEVNAYGLLIKTTDALNHTRSYAYDKVGNLVSHTDAKSNETRLAYDAMNRMLRSTAPNTATSVFQYNAQSEPTAFTDPDGRQTKLEYDNFLRLIKRLDGSGNAIQYSYQIADGSISGALGSLNAPTETIYPTYIERTRYDQVGRPTTTTLVDPSSSERTGNIAYDVRGLAKSNTNAYGKSRMYSYDGLGRRRIATDMLGKPTQLQYDARSNLLQVTDANGNARRYEYDRNSRVIKEVLALGQTIATTYNASGNVASRTDSNGNKTDFTYDAANRLTQVRHYNASNILQRTISYTWSATNQAVAWSDKAGGTEASGAISYDELGRTTGETVTYPGGFTMSYAYTYSQAGRKTQLKWPDGSAIGYGYSGHGELDSITVPNEGTISINQFKWMAPASVTLPGGTIQEKSYDGLLNLTDLKVKAPNQETLLSLANTYGKEQETSQSARADTSSGTTKISNYTYDDENRLTRVVSDTGGVFGTDTESFTLDAVANRIAHSQVAGAWIYDANNRLKQIGTGAGTTTYEYDDAGNLIRKAEPGSKVTRYVYNSANRLEEVKDGASQLIARYGYDPMGRRIWKEQYREKDGSALSQAKRTYYLYAEEGLIAEATQPITLNPDQSVSVDGVAAITTQYGPRPGAYFNTGVLFIKTKNTNNLETVAYYHHDRLGTPIQATDRLGKIVWAAVYNAFGQAQIVTPSPTMDKPTIASNLRLPGQVEDAETGLYYNMFRDYDPQTGRYLQSDPIGLQGGINTYAYVAGDPVNGTDPLGLWVFYVGGTGSIFGGPLGASSGGGFVVDSSGNWGTYKVVGVGGGVGDKASFGLSIGVLGATRDAPVTKISDFGGPFENASGSVALGPSVSIDTFHDPYTTTNGGGGVTIGAGVGGGISVQATNTTVTPNTLTWQDFVPNWVVPKPNYPQAPIPCPR